MPTYFSSQSQQSVAIGQAILMSLCLVVTLTSLIITLATVLQQRSLRTILAQQSTSAASTRLALIDDEMIVDPVYCDEPVMNHDGVGLKQGELYSDNTVIVTDDDILPSCAAFGSEEFILP